MKNFLKILALVLSLLMLLSVVVACDGGKGNGGGNEKNDEENNNDQNNEEEEEEGSSKGKYEVVFQVKDPATGKVIYESKPRQIKKNQAASAPNGATVAQANEDCVRVFADLVIDGWDSDGDGKVDTKHTKVTKDLTCVAVLREKKTFTVSFYEEDGTTLYKSLSVKENDKVTTAETDALGVPIKIGYAFASWVATDITTSSLNMVTGDLGLKATYTPCDGTIPMVGKNDVTVDGLKEAAYDKAALLPFDNTRPAQENSNWKDDAHPTGHVQSDIDGVGHIVWDGDYIYVLIEVADSTLSGRSTYFVNMVSNSYLTDAAELWYTLNQSYLKDNRMKISIDAMGIKKFTNYQLYEFSLNGTYRSTHFEEIKIATATAIGSNAGNGVDIFNTTTPDPTLKNDDTVGTGFGKEGVFSYRVEIAIPAKTEGVADVAGAQALGYTIDETNGYLMNFSGAWDETTETGSRTWTETDANGKTVTVKDADRTHYMFTDGTKLIPGCIAKFSLQLNDLQHTMADLAIKTNGCHEYDQTYAAANNQVIDWTDKTQTTHQSYLVDAAGNPVWPDFFAAGHTQFNTAKYFSFSLGDENTTEGYSKFWDFDDEGNALDKDGKVVERSEE